MTFIGLVKELLRKHQKLIKNYQKKRLKELEPKNTEKEELNDSSVGYTLFSNRVIVSLTHFSLCLHLEYGLHNDLMLR